MVRQRFEWFPIPQVVLWKVIDALTGHVKS
jgi:hypothetical protein